MLTITANIRTGRRLASTRTQKRPGANARIANTTAATPLANQDSATRSSNGSLRRTWKRSDDSCAKRSVAAACARRSGRDAKGHDVRSASSAFHGVVRLDSPKTRSTSAETTTRRSTIAPFPATIAATPRVPRSASVSSHIEIASSSTTRSAARLAKRRNGRQSARVVAPAAVTACEVRIGL